MHRVHTLRVTRSVFSRSRSIICELCAARMILWALISTRSFPTTKQTSVKSLLPKNCAKLEELPGPSGSRSWPVVEGTCRLGKGAIASTINLYTGLMDALDFCRVRLRSGLPDAWSQRGSLRTAHITLSGLWRFGGKRRWGHHSLRALWISPQNNLWPLFFFLYLHRFYPLPASITLPPCQNERVRCPHRPWRCPSWR